MEPVFVKAKGIINFITINEIDMFEAESEKFRPENVFGIQRTGMVCGIYITNQESRLTLLTQHIGIGEQTIESFSNNPLRVGLKAGEHDNDIVKILIKGIPLSKGSDLINEFSRVAEYQSKKSYLEWKVKG